MSQFTADVRVHRIGTDLERLQRFLPLNQPSSVRQISRDVSHIPTRAFLVDCFEQPSAAVDSKAHQIGRGAKYLIAFTHSFLSGVLFAGCGNGPSEDEPGTRAGVSICMVAEPLRDADATGEIATFSDAKAGADTDAAISFALGALKEPVRALFLPC